jgi:anti-sigma B factor antagonist/stage II sporulation protein AA (anti-sigma F factor antagonist)
MKVTAQRFADALVVQVEGRLDHDTSPEFSSRLGPMVEEGRREGGAIVLDFAALDYISSSGLSSLIAATRQSKPRQHRLYVAALQPLVLEMFEISHLNLLLEVFPTVREALGRVSPQAVAAFDLAAGR